MSAPPLPGLARRGLLALPLLASHALGAAAPPHSYHIERAGSLAIVKACHVPYQTDCRTVAEVPGADLRAFSDELGKAGGGRGTPLHQGGGGPAGDLLGGGAALLLFYLFDEILGIDPFPRVRFLGQAFFPVLLTISAIHFAGYLLERTGIFASLPGRGPRALLRRQIRTGAVDGRAGRSSELFAEFLRRHRLPPDREAGN